MCGHFFDVRTDLQIFVNGAVNARRDLDEILGPHVIQFTVAIGWEFVLIDDNTTAHCARIINQHLYDQGVTRMEWSTMSPDMNPVEHALDMPQRHCFRTTT